MYHQENLERDPLNALGCTQSLLNLQLEDLRLTSRDECFVSPLSGNMQDVEGILEEIRHPARSLGVYELDFNILLSVRNGGGPETDCRAGEMIECRCTTGAKLLALYVGKGYQNPFLKDHYL